VRGHWGVPKRPLGKEGGQALENMSGRGQRAKKNGEKKRSGKKGKGICLILQGVQGGREMTPEGA